MSALPAGSAPGWLSIHDKVAHLGAYAVLGGCLAWGHRRSGGAVGHLWLLLAGAAYGVSDELHQFFVPGRSPELADLAADVVGLLIGYGTTQAILGRTTDENDTVLGAGVDEGETS